MKGGGTLTLLRVWLSGTGAVIAFLLVWTIAPVLFLVLLLTAGLGLLSFAMVALARKLEAWKDRKSDAQ